MTFEKRLILAVEDNPINLRLLHKILSGEYTVLEAQNGQEALAILKKYSVGISCVVLDLVMPVMDGFTFLQYVKQEKNFQNIPIVVATGNSGSDEENRALALGAWDFVKKPYNAEILMFRIRNSIERSQISLLEQLRYQTEFDTLTGIYSKTKFFEMAKTLLLANPKESFAMVRFDIDRFQLFNSFYGSEEGDRILMRIASVLSDSFRGSAHYCYGRIEADVFACCMSYQDRGELEEELRRIQGRVKKFSQTFDLVLPIGIYCVEDHALPIIEIFDRAVMAAKTCKGKYLETIACYQPEFSSTLKREQTLINVMNAALEHGEFCIHYQPKYSLKTKQPAGAEALVWWKNPDGENVSPGQFIPLFEKNGFIVKLDRFVWETVCLQMKTWMEQGIKLQPVSVNISRVSLYNPQLVDIFNDLTAKYGIPRELLQLELTESAYMDNPYIMKETVKRLHRSGYTVLMDDFGSGYSSLNTLKEIDVDLLKADLKFLSTSEDLCKSKKILVSVIRMAGWLGIPVIVEGVETERQERFLTSVGCSYAQGYYFSHALPPEDYEKLLRSQSEISDVLENSSLSWQLEKKIAERLESLAEPIALYRVENDSFHCLWASGAFDREFGRPSRDEQILFHPEQLERVRNSLGRAVKENEGIECECFLIPCSGGSGWYRLLFKRLVVNCEETVLQAAFFKAFQQDGTQMAFEEG